MQTSTGTTKGSLTASFLYVLCRFVLDLFSERKVATSWDPVEGESHLDTLLRAIVISRLGKAGDQVLELNYPSCSDFSNP